MKALIGVIPLFDEERDSIWMVPGYLEGIRAAGGLPIILPLKADDEELKQLCAMCDGFLFTGGQDVDPILYKEVKHEKCGAANSDRDKLEQKIFDHALSEDKPVFGICRGLQLINVLCGGTLYQDLPSEYTGSKNLQHRMKPPYDMPCHLVTILADTPLAQMLQVSTLGVNSCHHQGIKELAACLRPMAVAEDGLIEAVYRPDRKFVQAVQWHPEYSYLADNKQRRLFESFVKACSSKNF